MDELPRMIKCKCGNNIPFPFLPDFVIHPVGCEVYAEIGFDKVLFKEGHKMSGCPPLENFRYVSIKCLSCRKIPFAMDLSSAV